MSNSLEKPSEHVLAAKSIENCPSNNCFALLIVWLLISMVILIMIMPIHDIRRPEPYLEPKLENKLLVIFTTFKNDPNKTEIHKAVINNWSSFGKDIQPVFFYNKTSTNFWDGWALKKGWIGLPIGSTNKFGTPVLKDMQMRVSKMIKSEFYGFCNGDILFDPNMKRTLMSIWNDKNVLKNSTMVIGKRTNVEYEDYYNNTKVFNTNRSLNLIATTKGSLFMEYAEDYFFIHSPENFPWDAIKDVVIGRRGYDNYLVSEAIKHNVHVIDATNSLLAVHLTGSDGNYAGLRNIDKEYNMDLIGEYDFSLGSTDHAQYYTKVDEKGNIVVLKR